jgi:alpha-tubulin suppressor-like RCC1 family protein
MSSDRPKPATNAFVWGYNNTGELSLGHAGRVFGPAPARLPKGVVDLQGGADFSVALTSSGQVWTWGSNEHGQLGDGSREARREPKKVHLPHGLKAAAIAAGTDHVVMLTNHGTVLSWGRNHRGQLGVGDRDDLLRPKTAATPKVKAVAAGDGISAAIGTRGQLFVWGRNGSGQLGLQGHHGRDVLDPTRSTVVDQVAAVDAGLRHLVVLTWLGQVATFGLGPSGKPLGGHLATDLRWGQIRSISAGEDHTLALTNRGLVLAWGANDLGQLGVGDREHRLTPVRVTLPGAGGRVTSIRAGHRHNLALTSKNEVYAWGDGRFGALGAGRPKPDAVTVATPQRVPLPAVGITRLGGGGYTSAVFVDSGPAVALQLRPATTTVTPDEPIAYKIRAVDAFGTDLGPAPAGVALKVPGGTATGTHAAGSSTGTYTVVARAGALTGRATFHVHKGHH